MGDLIYKQIYLAIKDCNSCLKLTESYSAVEVKAVIRSVMRNHPDLFWFAHQYSYDINNSTISFKYIFSTDKISEIKEAIKDVIYNDFGLEYVKTLTQLEQVVYVYKWLVTFCNYNLYSAYNQSIYSVFVCRNSVCTGYAKSAQYLFDLLGVESRLVFGKLHNDNKDGRHCWNLVMVDNQWYHFDACFGDIILNDVALKSGVGELLNIGGINYNFLCASTDDILKTRSIEEIEKLPMCRTSWSIRKITVLAGIEIVRRPDNRGVLLSSKGFFSDVYLCAADKNVVLKCYREPIDTKRVWAEYVFADRLRNCKHLLHPIDAYTNADSGIIAFEQAVPVMDIIMSPYSSFSLRDALRMIRDVSCAIDECHGYNIYYKDIHLNNIYRSCDGIYKLSDYGSCGWDFQSDAISMRKRVEASKWFMAPETYNTDAFDIESAVYSITLSLYFILNDFTLPFQSKYGAEVALQKRCNGDLITPLCLHFNEEINDKINALLLKGLDYDRSKRFQGISEYLECIDDILLSLVTQDYSLCFNKHGILNSPFNFTSQSCITTSLEVVDSEVVCPNCGYHYSARISHDLVQQLFLLPKENIANGGITTLQNQTDLLRCPNCCYEIPAGVAYQNNILSLNCSGDLLRTVIEGYCTTRKVSDDYSYADRYCTTCGFYSTPDDDATYDPIIVDKETTQKKSLWQRLFKGRSYDDIYSSIYAPAEVKKKSHLLTQVYFHLFEDSIKVQSLARAADRNAQRRGYVALSLKVKKGDKLDVEFNIYGGTCMLTERKSLIWQGSMVQCYFDYFVPENIDVDELSCEANIFVNGALIGEMRFLTKIVDAPRALNPHVDTRRFNRIFISYAHQDADQIKFLALAYKAQGVDYFYDRHSLAPGDVYEEKIFDYIDSSDLFVLCWSKNAESSEYVAKEKGYALQRAYPQKTYETATLKICPFSIEPRAELPNDMKGIYNFEEI